MTVLLRRLILSKRLYSTVVPEPSLQNAIKDATYPYPLFYYPLKPPQTWAASFITPKDMNTEKTTSKCIIGYVNLPNKNTTIQTPTITLETFTPNEEFESELFFCFPFLSF